MTTRFGVIFPGQGSQSVGMLAELATACPEVQETFSEASEVLDYDLWQLVQTDPEGTLNNTTITQPAMLAAGVAAWRCWLARGGAKAAFMAGHSLGEYSALVCAGALDFPTAVSLVAARARYMQAAVPEGLGAMAAILGLDDEIVQAACAEGAEDEVVAAVNFNAPGQVVIAGDIAAVERTQAIALEKGARKAIGLPVSVPSHCSLMEPAARRLEKKLQAASLATPTAPVLHNVDARTRPDADGMRRALVQQLSHPVRWVDTIREMQAQGVEQLMECGPGRVLTGLNRRIERRMGIFPIFDATSLDKALVKLAGT